MWQAVKRDTNAGPEAPLPAPPALSPLSARNATKRILFVDDRPDTYLQLREALRPSGSRWQVDYAPTADEALAGLALQPADVIVVDERISGTDGVTLLTEVRDRHPTTIRMILAGATTPGLASIVSHRLLSKPCNVAELGVLIKRSCALQKRTEEVEALRRTMSTTALPSRPGVYIELDRVLSDPQWEPAHVADVIERDVAISAKVLQLANSALFGLASTVTTVRTAVTYLGVDTIRSLALTSEAFGKLAPASLEGFSLDQFQSHAMLVAQLTATILPPGRTQQEAVTAALLHDVGKLVAVADGSRRWAAHIDLARLADVPVHEVELEYDGVTHADVGAYLLSLWGLPDVIVEAVAGHHNPGSVPGLAFDAVAAVHIANALAHELEPASENAPPAASINPQLIDHLGLQSRLDLWRQAARRLAGELAGIGSASR